MTNQRAWINGRILPFADAAVAVSDLGVVAGASITDMARTIRHQPFLLERHVERLHTSLTELRFPIHWDRRQLLDAAAEIAEANTAGLPAEMDLGIVMFSTAGSNATYLGGQSTQTTTCIHTFPLPFNLWRSGVTNGVRLTIPSIRQIPADCFDIRHKVRNRLHWWLADHEAATIAPGSKALLLDHDDHVTETSTSCFYLVIHGEIVTSDRGVLNSLSRQFIEELAERCGIPFVRRAVQRSELGVASEAFLSSTPSGLMAVSHLDDRRFELPCTGNLCAGPIMRRLLDEYHMVTGLRPDQQILQASA